MKRIILFAALLLAQGLALAGDWSKPLTTSTYTNFVTEVKARDTDLALGFDPAYTTPTNLSTNTIGWSSAARKWRLWNGTAWVDLATTYAISADSLNAANSYTVTGLTVSGGTANGVAYLNGSKALTSGSALTFDGSSLNLGQYLGTAGRLNVTTAPGATFQAASYMTNGVDTDFAVRVKTGLSDIGTLTSTPLTFSYGGTEGMRLSSTGLGVGTSSITDRLNVAGYTNSTSGFKINTDAAILYEDVGRSLVIAADNGNQSANSSIRLQIDGSMKFMVDAAGNAGLGVTPSAWDAGRTVFQFGPVGFLRSDAGSTSEIGANSYFNGTNWIYQTTNGASRFAQSAGVHYWFTAPSGTAGTPITFTQAMVLDSTGLTATLNTATTATTQAQNDNSTKVATTAYADRPATETAAGRVALATVAQAITGTDTTHAVTSAGVAAAIDAKSLGIGQTWQNVTASRAVSTTYTNSTGRPITVLIGFGGGGVTPTINGNVLPLFSSANGSTNTVYQFVVPNGQTYSITTGGAGFVWWELR